MMNELESNNIFFQNLDPRLKLLLVIAMSIFLAMSSQIRVLLTALLLGLIIALSARIHISDIIRRLIPANLFLLFIWIIVPFSMEGSPLFAIGPLICSREGFVLAIKITIKSNAIMIYGIFLMATTPVFTLGHAMHKLRLSKKLVHLFFFTYRYIHVINQEYMRLMSALKIRGFHPETSLHTYRTFAYLIGMLLIRSLDRAQRVHQAMLCRGFHGKLYSIQKFSITKTDMLVFSGFSAAILALGIMEWTAAV